MAKSFLNISGYPLGLRNNNPGNLRATGDNWQGMIGTNQGFVVFQDIAYGIRALAIDLTGDIRDDGLNTIEKLVYQFAPPYENNTEAYITSLCASSGLSRRQILQADGSTLLKIIRGIIKVENGQQYASLINDQDISEGISMMGTKVPVGEIGFGVSTLLFGVALYLYFTRQKMPKRKTA